MRSVLTRSPPHPHTFHGVSRKGSLKARLNLLSHQAITVQKELSLETVFLNNKTFWAAKLHGEVFCSLQPGRYREATVDCGQRGPGSHLAVEFAMASMVLFL